MKTILLVEDNPDDVALTLHAMRQNRLDSQVVVANDGAAALDYLFTRAPGELPRLVLLDLKLPKIDGFGVLERMRSDPRTRCLPVVVLTSSCEEQDLADCYHRGANSYIRKPVDYDHFLAVIRELGLYWLELNEAPPQEWQGGAAWTS